MNYPITFYHPSQHPQITCTKYRHCRRNVSWPYGLGYRLLGHATISLADRGTEIQVIHVENGFGKRKVVVPDKCVKAWQQIERTWHGDASLFFVAWTAIEAYLAKTDTTANGNGRANHRDSPLVGINTKLEYSADGIPL